MKITARIISAAAAAVMAVCSVSLNAFASEKAGRIRISAVNNNFSISDGAAWDGTLFDIWIDIDGEEPLSDAVMRGFKASGYSVSGLDTGYVTDINGVGTATASDMGGWMFTLNDWFTNESPSAYTLSDGDEICYMYSCNWGADIGSDWSGSSTLLKDVVFSTGTLDKDFLPETDKYTLTVTDSDNIRVTPSAENKNFQVRIYKNNYTPEVDGSEYKRSEYIPVADGDVLYIGVGDPSWPSMNGGQTETVYKFSIVSADTKPSDDQKAADAVDALIARIGEVTSESREAIKKARAAYERLTAQQKALCSNYSILAAAEEAYSRLSEQKLASFDELYSSVADYLLKSGIPGIGSVGGEWTVIGLARSGRITEEFSKGYYENAVKYIRSAGSAKLSNTRSTENSRMILALTSRGYDVADVGGYNLFEPLADFDYVVKQGINGAAYALIALDSRNYDIPETDSENTVTRKKLIDYILDTQLTDGGWSLNGENADIDISSMVLTALAPYYDEENVRSAVNKALDMLSAAQNPDGTFSSTGEGVCESTSQAVIALASLGIDPSSDERFVKNGVSAADALKLFYADGGFSHIVKSGSADRMASEQGFCALAAYYRLMNGGNSLFDMTDVPESENPAVSDKNNVSSKSDPSADKLPATGNCSKAIVLMLAAVSIGAAVTVKRKSIK